MSFIIRLAFYYRLIVLTSFFSLGIVLGRFCYFPPMPSHRFFLVSLFFTFLFCGVAITFYRCRRCRYFRHFAFIFAIFVSVVLGVLHISQAMRLPQSPTHIYNIIASRKEVVGIGIMNNMPQERRDDCQNVSNSKAIIDCKWLSLKQENSEEITTVTAKNPPHFTPVEGKIVLRIQEEWPKNILPGDVVLFRAYLKRPQSYRSPAAFDYAQNLARHGIWVTGFVRTPLFLRKIEMGEGLESFPRLRYVVERLRSRINSLLYEKIPRHAPLYAAILLGEKSGIPKKTYEAFSRCGILHILAISGMHLTVLFTLFHFGCYRLLCRSNLLMLEFSHIVTAHALAALCTLPFLISYALLAGLKPPVLRALIMSCVVILSFIYRGRAVNGTLLALAALLLLLINPHQLFMASFQLSFTAVAAIFFLLPYLQPVTNSVLKMFFPLQKRQKKPQLIVFYRFVAASFFLSSGISLLTAPIIIYHFHRLSLVGAIVTLLVEPLICFCALPCGLTSLPFLLSEIDVLENIGTVFLHIGALGFTLSHQLIEYIATFSFVSCWVSLSSTWFWIGVPSLYGSIILLIISRQFFAGNSKKRGEKENDCRRLLQRIGFIFMFFALLLFFAPNKEVDRVVFLDVGQGSATVIENTTEGERYCALIDGGGTSFGSSSVGERVIAPYLWSRGILQLNEILITHSDSDHTNGLPFIIDVFQPQKLIVRDEQEEHPRLEQIRYHMGKNNLQSVEEREEVFRRGNFTLASLYNFGLSMHKKGYGSNRNIANRGVVFSAKMQGFSILFPGDIDREAEEFLFKNKFLERVNFLLAAHHGSKTSNSSIFIETLSPEIIIVSAGKNKGLYPSKDLRLLSEKKAIPLYSTADFGTMELEFKEGEARLYYYRKKEDNPLHAYTKTLLYHIAQ